MSFDSLDYLIFLPVVTLLHWLCPSRWRWGVLLVASFLFYMSWNPALVWLIFGMTLISYLAALALSYMKRARVRRCVMGLTVFASLALLVYFKYFNFLGRSTAALLSVFGGTGVWNFHDIVLPVGISFYTFQALSYFVDVYRGTLRPQRHLGYYALYISFFPQLVAGPIERAGALMPQLEAQRTLHREDLNAGCKLLISGFFRKIVIADSLAVFVDAVYKAPTPDGSAVFLGTALFAAQIYCDFAGYSEIAAGSARLLGIRLMRNFDRPYVSVSIREFWRRWHISLTQWFSDYVYIPLGGSRRGFFRQIQATFAVFLLSGLWHGADWSFVVWGLLHGCYMTLELLGRKYCPPIHSPLIRLARRCGVLAAVGVAWVFFRAENMEIALRMMHALLSPWNLRSTFSLLMPVLAQRGGSVCILSLLVLLPCSVPILERLQTDSSAIGKSTCLYLILAIVLAWMVRLQSGGANAFIYFQF